MQMAENARDCTQPFHLARWEEAGGRTKGDGGVSEGPLLFLNPKLGVRELIDLALQGVHQVPQGPDLVLGAIPCLFEAVW